MDKGAHFYRCDFQVHSPRDIQWTGRKFGINIEDLPNISDEQKAQILADRVQFCKEYLEKIRNSGLNAIAMTDHHDVIFVKQLRLVSQLENQAFAELGQFDKMITIFPGIELSLANPVSQCILIFDADFTDTNLDAVIHVLGFDPTNEFEKNTKETLRISAVLVPDLIQLAKKLDALPYCQGKYIMLPNVTHGGSDSILRNGFQEHYIKMPCVGGYVDKAISTEAGYQNKINGGDVNYGNKSIALISTSDNRFEDGRMFGQYATWIKWAEPTAEAIRQACLAKESRISQVEPELPQVYIQSIDVTTSKFLGAFNISFNQQYNALIGGRGTGKSTILEYLRWGLCDQTIQIADYDELTVIEKRREALIQKTLYEVSGEVRVSMEKNGILHIVKRNSRSKEILLKIGDGEFQQVKEDDIRKLLPIQSYSQKQLSDVGVKTEELKRFIEQPILGHLAAIKFQINEAGLKLKQSYNQLIRKKEVEHEIENLGLESKSLNDQVNNIKKSLKGVSDGDQIIINKKSKFEKEQTIINNSKAELNLFESKADELIELFSSYPEPNGDISDLENTTLIQNISIEVEAKFVEIKSAINSLKGVFSENSLQQFTSFIKDWEIKKGEFEVAYETAKSKSLSSQMQLSEILRIEVRISEINKIVSDRGAMVKEIGNPEVIFNEQRRNWNEYHKQKVILLNEQALKFAELSRNLIKAEVTKSVNLNPLKIQLKNVFEGTRIREERIDAVINYIKQSTDPIQGFSAILEEFRLLAELKVSDDKTLTIPETPLLSGCGFSDEHKGKLCSKITPDDWLKLSINELEFDPEFYYITNNQLGDVIPFKEASAGQQATALLTVLLNQPGMPLLIDQPEDDIDNRAIDQIIKNIWEAKKKRQLIFTSHNANLVVNGDAELVICCDYRDSNSQTRGVLKAEGAIDKKEVKNEITSVMEGGEKAFRLRKDKYGY